ncbi:hypothetical protein D1646_02870 [Pseudoflavonifractor sp. 60]|uniref:hypothetical protein n=1 Tax=Pseudoflavonifractor sp. 60 TaxID=2304576 RepID=UPI001368B045|nr:hypothetical protein [Pseudoflavonifractor sp. 60]NBI65767.1 hypothetical protein [Pseudoflavonifractor sp. 60]
MLSNERRRDLEDLFFLDGTPPDHLADEEWEYWSTLSQQWDQALSHIYQKISQQDNLRDKTQ